MKTVLVTGGKGQLALCLKDLTTGRDNMRFIFTDIEELDISNTLMVSTYFKETKIDYCINCAAYTAVDEAESNYKMAHLINVEGAKNLAVACEEFNTTLIHISTDFVFDGKKTGSYIEDDETNPLSVYGKTKLEGENAIQHIIKNHFIVRTSWLYSEYGKNFMKTMIRLGRERKSLSIINDQKGTPTYAGDLARILLTIVESENQDFGTYHYSNDGVASWFDFAKEIFLQESLEIELKPIPTSAYPTPAQRPKNSVLDKAKIREILKIEIPAWKKSLNQALKAYGKL